VGRQKGRRQARRRGSYSATFAVDYGTVFKPTLAKSGPFILDLSTPSGSISLSQALFSPIESNPTLTIGIDATSPIAKMESWSLRINDPAGNLFKSFEGRWPNAKIVWDGKGIAGDLVESAEDYAVTATVRDELAIPPCSRRPFRWTSSWRRPRPATAS